MHDALSIDEIKPKALHLTPLPLPLRASGPLTSLSWPTASSTLGASRGKGAIDTEHHHRPTPFPYCNLSDALVDLLTRWCHIQHAEALGRSIRQGVHPLTAKRDRGEIVKEGFCLVVGGLHDQFGRRLLYIELVATRR